MGSSLIFSVFGKSTRPGNSCSSYATSEVLWNRIRKPPSKGAIWCDNGSFDEPSYLVELQLMA